MSRIITLANQMADPYCLLGSRWQNFAAEVIVWQTIQACKINLAKHGVAFSWLAVSATTGRDQAGTNNAHGLQLLINDKCLEQQDYTGPAVAPSATVLRNGVPQVLTVTDRLLDYLERLLCTKT